METLTILISLIALFISIGSLYLSYKAFDRDKPDLRISLEYWTKVETEKACFNVRVTNHGRRIARVEIIRIHFNHGEPLWESVAGGKLINEGEPFDCQLPIYGSNEIPTHNPTEVKFVEVFDTIGRRYKFPGISIKDWIEFRKLKARILQYWDME